MRDELSDYEWTAIKPMLPNKPRGVRRVNDRRVLSGIFWVLRARDKVIARRANHFWFSEIACPAPFAKIFRFGPDPNHFYIDHRPVPREGRCARHQRGAGCGGRG